MAALSLSYLEKKYMFSKDSQLTLEGKRAPTYHNDFYGYLQVW